MRLGVVRQRLDGLARLADRVQRLGRQVHAGPAAGGGDDVGFGERAPANGDALHGTTVGPDRMAACAQS